MNLRSRLRCALIALVATCTCSAAVSAQTMVHPEDALRLDRMPILQPGAIAASISSYDRTGGNDDGFSGRYSFLRKEGDALVIADLKGPGIIYRIWTPTPTDRPLEFYIDGETTPRITLPFEDLFSGRVAPFIPPLCNHGLGGYYCYLPIAYRDSCKIVYRGPVIQFLQINHVTLPAGQTVESFQQSSEAVRRTQSIAAGLLGKPGSDIARSAAPAGSQLTTVRFTKTIAPGSSAVLFDLKSGGRIVGMRIKPASALAGADRAIVLRAWWDGAKQPAIACPAADFFGFSWGDPSMRSFVIGTADGIAYCYIPMPFSRAAKIELANERSNGAPIQVTGELTFSSAKLQPGEGRFYAVWSRENPTTTGQPFTFVDTASTGKLVGVNLQAQGKESGNTYFFEGDDVATIDGAMRIHGTGSEDFFNGGWYDVPGRWAQRTSLPFSGCLDYRKEMGRTGAYRFFTGDAYYYDRSLNLTIEHGPDGNRIPTDYVGVAYLYATKPPKHAGDLPAALKRAATVPTRLEYAVGWAIPIDSFPMENATLARHVERIGKEDVRLLSLRTSGADTFGAPSIGFQCTAPAAGHYRILIDAIRGPEAGSVELLSGDTPTGKPINLQADTRSRSGLVAVGEVGLPEGPCVIRLRLKPASANTSATVLDLVTLVLERI